MLSYILDLLDYLNASRETRLKVIYYGLGFLLGQRVMNYLRELIEE